LTAPIPDTRIEIANRNLLMGTPSGGEVEDWV